MTLLGDENMFTMANISPDTVYSNTGGFDAHAQTGENVYKGSGVLEQFNLSQFIADL